MKILLSLGPILASMFLLTGVMVSFARWLHPAVFNFETEVLTYAAGFILLTVYLFFDNGDEN